MILFGSCEQEAPTVLTIAAAANLQFAVDSLASVFTEQTSINCQLTTGSSGKLATQLLNGAPYDIFLSADEKSPASLAEAGLTTAEPEVYAYGKLVIWSSHYTSVSWPQTLLENRFRKLAVANPTSAPYGAAAFQAIRDLPNFDAMIGKIIYGESVSQAAQFVHSGSCELGFVAMSTVRNPNFHELGSWAEVAPDAYTPISQSLVVMNDQKGETTAATKFRDFLFSPEGRRILEVYGYATAP